MSDELQKLYGIGEIQAKKIRKALLKAGEIQADEIYSESALRRILLKSSIYDSLTSATKADLKYKPDKEIPRKIIAILEKAIHPDTRAVVAGSYRRKKAVSRDVDIVLPTSWDAFKRSIGSKVSFTPSFAQGESKISVFAKIKSTRVWTVKCDIFLTTPREFMFALLFATGSGRFNMIMRAQAKRKGLLLNQRGLWQGSVRVPGLQTDRDVFKALDMKYREPDQRL